MEAEAPAKRKGERPDPRAETERAFLQGSIRQDMLPAFNIKACLRKAAKSQSPRQGKAELYGYYMMPGVVIEPEHVPLLTPSGDPAKDWKLDLRPVVVQKARTIRARPRFDEWELEFNVAVLTRSSRRELKTFIDLPVNDN